MVAGGFLQDPRYGAQQRGGTRLEPQGLVARKLAQSRLVRCASPEYLKRSGVLRVPSDLLEHACVALVTTDNDVADRVAVRKRTAAKERQIPSEALVQAPMHTARLVPLVAELCGFSLATLRMRFNRVNLSRF